MSPEKSWLEDYFPFEMAPFWGHVCLRICTLQYTIGCSPLQATLTTRIITCLVGNPSKPSFATATGRGLRQSFRVLPSPFFLLYSSPFIVIIYTSITQLIAFFFPMFFLLRRGHESRNVLRHGLQCFLHECGNCRRALARDTWKFGGLGRSGSDGMLQTSDVFFHVRSRFFGRKTPIFLRMGKTQPPPFGPPPKNGGFS